jgi:hypothetical protein
MAADFLRRWVRWAFNRRTGIEWRTWYARNPQLLIDGTRLAGTLKRRRNAQGQWIYRRLTREEAELMLDLQMW